jgi:hypothetical protein
VKSDTPFIALLIVIVVLAGVLHTTAGKQDPEVQVRVFRRIADAQFTEVNEFKITEENGVRYCGNGVVSKHAVHLPWLRDLQKPAGGLKGLDLPPRNCRSVLLWDGRNFCLDRLERKSRILDLVRRCTEF